MSSRLLALLGAATALGGCFIPQPPSTPAARIVSTTLQPGTVLTAGSSFTVTTDGRAVVDVQFGPRQISKLVTADNPTATFDASELPEGHADMMVTLQGTQRGPGSTRIERVTVDRTPPVLVGVQTMRLGAGQTLRLWVWDAVMMGFVEATIGGTTVRRDLPPSAATRDPLLVEIDGGLFPEGRWNLELRLADAVGNEARQTVPGAIVDRSPPNVSFTAPTAGSPASGQLQIAAAATDNLGPTIIELRAGGSSLAELTGPSATAFVDTSLFPRGPLTLEAVARDAAGNTSLPAQVEVVVQ